MTAYLLAGPAQEPVSLVESKAFLRVDGTDEDDLITTLITAARLHVESITSRALIEQSWRIVLDYWPASGEVSLPISPVLSVTQIRAYNADGVPSILPLAQFQPETQRSPAKIYLPPAIMGMPILRVRNGIEIDYSAGYGSEADDVPVDMKQALMTLIAYWFEHRDAVLIAGSGAIVPSGFDTLISAYRAVRL